MNAVNSGLFSHPDRYLEEHVGNVIQFTIEFFKETGISNEILKDILTIIAFSHDIGKATDYFQQYIRGNESLKNKQETKHSLLGGIIGFYLADKYLSNLKIEDPFLLSLAFIVPRRHHSNLNDFYSEFYFDENDFEIIKKQIESIDRQRFDIFLQNLQAQKKELLNFSLEEINLKEIQEKLEKLKRFFRKLKKLKDENNFNYDYYIKTILMFSLLLDADKSDVGIKVDKSLVFNKDRDKSFDIKPEFVDDFVKNLPKENTLISNLRKYAYKEVSEKEIDINQKIYTLTLPTGLGKTLISLKFALKIAQKVKQEKGIDLRIIYSLPFLSIIEQNHNVIEKVLENSKITVDNNLLLKHHHLTGFNYISKDEEFDYDTSRILIEGWNSRIIVTTFMQFFYSIIGNRNKMLRKFHRLTNSIVILDEIQSIPHRYWLLLKKILTEMASKFNFYVILSTATQPLIFDSSNACEIITKKECYFKNLNRYNVYINTNKQTIEEFYKNLEIKENKSYLFIMNTVNSAETLYNLIKKEYPDTIFLSTHIVPKERLRRIKQLKEGKVRIAVSTQLVEAGVDIDFDVVYRDFAPLDSLIQSAGRCNREGKREMGEFNVVQLYDDKNNIFFYSYIYDTILTSTTQEIVENKSYIENQFINLVEDYFKEIQKRKSDNDSIKLLKLLCSLTFSGEKGKEINSIQDFILIEEDKYKEDVFIELDDEAKSVWEEYKKIWNIPNIFERKKAFDEIKSIFYQYVISVPLKDNKPDIQNGFYYVPYSDLEKFYNRETGFIKKGDLFWIY